MKFIKKFDTQEDYNNYIFSENYIKPNVSKINNNNNTLVKFDEDAAYLDVKINVSTTELPTLLSSNSSNSIEKIILENGTILNTPDSSPYSLSYQFDTIGIHNIKVKFRKINDEYKIYPDLSGNSNITKISIPSIYTIYPNAFSGCTNLSELILPNNLKVIPSGLLGGCFNIKSLKIPNTVERIEPGALVGNSINEINIPDNVTYIGPNIFGGNQGLKKITFGRGITDINQLALCGILGVYDIENIVILGNIDTIPNAFSPSRQMLKNVTIPNTIKNINSQAFDGCLQLTTINIPNTIEYVADNAFSGCNSLPIEDGLRYADKILICNTDTSKSSYTIKNGTILMCSHMFDSCTNLESISIPNTLKKISNYAFSGCIKLSKINIPNSVTSIGDNAFSSCYELSEINIPNSVTSIGDNAFSSCIKLSEINIPNSVTTIGDRTFYDCPSLPIINDIQYADTYLIKVNNTNKSSYTIKEGTRFIGADAFGYCQLLTYLEIPNTVISIGLGCFHCCHNLLSIEIPSSVISIGSRILEDCSKIEYISVNSNNQYYDSRNNCNAIIETSTNTLIVGCKNTIIPNSVTSIGDNAFYINAGLTSIIIPNSVTSIGARAFDSNTGLTSIIIPNSVTSIGNYAFKECTGLEEITISNSISYIGMNAFKNCTGLEEITILSINPPILDFINNENGPFYNTNNCPIYVPTEYVNAYKTAQKWTIYADRIQAIPSQE